MRYRGDEGWELVEPGDEVVPGYCAGDLVEHESYGKRWVSNIASDTESVVVTKEAPETWEHEKPAHGNWTSVSRITMVRPWLVPVTDEEVATLFGLTLTDD